MEDEYISLTYPTPETPLITFKQPTLTIPSVRSINDGLDFLLKKEVSPIALLTTGKHPNIYCAGLNFAIFTQHPQDIHNSIAEIVRLFGRFLALPFPSIALVNGHALAGGMMLMMSHDIRICVKKQKLKIGMTEINLGMTIPDGMLAPLDAKLDHEILRDICLFGKIISWNEAKEKKVVDHLVSQEQLMEFGIKIGEQMSSLGEKRDAYYGIKLGLWGSQIQRCQNGKWDEIAIRIGSKLKL